MLFLVVDGDMITIADDADLTFALLQTDKVLKTQLFCEYCAAFVNRPEVDHLYHSSVLSVGFVFTI